MNRMRKAGGCFLAVWVMAVVCAPALWAWSSDALARFDEANQLYQADKFEPAARLYEKLAQEYPETAAFPFNLGNSYYRLGEVGKAILAYERAKMRDPRNQDIRKNLEYVRGLIEYRVADKRNWYLRAGEIFLDHFTEREIAFLWLSVYFLFGASWAFVLFFRPGAPWGWRRKFLLMALVVFLLLDVAKKAETRVVRGAVVMAKQADVRYGPSGDDQVAFRVPEGLRVDVHSRREDWSRITLVNGESGWVPNNQIEEVLQ